jgi:hypothetical protein
MFAEVNGQKGAGLFNFDYNGRIWVYNSGLDPSAFSKLSLGWVLTGKRLNGPLKTAVKNSTSCAAMKTTNTSSAPKTPPSTACA